MLKILHLDTETTGRNAQANAVHQLSGGIEIEGELVEEFDFKVKPYPTAVISNEALKIAKVTVEQIMMYEDGMSVIRKLCNILEKHIDLSNARDKMFLSGYGCAHFDNPFFNSFFEQNGCGKYKSYFWTATIDTQVLAANALRYERNAMGDFKMETVAKRFNIDVDTTLLHNAAYDWKVSRLIYHALNKK